MNSHSANRLEGSTFDPTYSDLSNIRKSLTEGAANCVLLYLHRYCTSCFALAGILHMLVCNNVNASTLH